MTTKAYRSGEIDGLEWVHDQKREKAVHGEDVDLKDGLNVDGKIKADEGLINACSADYLSKWLGLSVRAVDARGPKFRKACDDYNAGWNAAINAAIGDE